MESAVAALISALGAEGLVFSLEASQRYTWSVLPVPVVERDGEGVRLGDINAEQRELVCELIDATFPALGVGAIAGGMSSDEVLGATSNRSDRDYSKDNYWLSVFGAPGGADMWAYQIEGHHLGVNVAVKGAKLSIGPILIGGAPLEDESGVPLLDEQINSMIDFAASLSADQRSAIIIADSPSEVDVNSRDASYSFQQPSSAGLAVAALQATQRVSLRQVLDNYLNFLPDDYAERKRLELDQAFSEAIVSWEGPLDAKPFGFQFRSDAMHIIFSGEDDAEHAHCLIRFPDDDYGADL